MINSTQRPSSPLVNLSALRLIEMLTGFCVLCTAVAFGTGQSQEAGPQLLAPVGNPTLSNNMPTLCWTGVQAEGLELWLDGRCLTSLPAGTTKHIPFPLSYGPHRWQVFALKNGQRVGSLEERFLIEDRPLAKLPEGSVLLRQNWKIASSLTVGTDGAALSQSDAKGVAWSESSVPTTVLGALVRNGVYPNPYIGMNNTLIPDSSDLFNKRHDTLRFSHLDGRNPWINPYWFVNSFTVPAPFKNKQVWLNFNELNYRAEIWLNGVRVARADQVVGMDRAYRFEVGKLLHETGANYLAVAIHPVDHPGLPAVPPTSAFADPGQNMGEDGLICMNYTRWDTQGWDWQPEVRDRDMGITEDVYLSFSEEVEIDSVYIAPQLQLGDNALADISLELEFLNHSGKAHVGTLHGVLTDDAGRKVEFTRACKISADTHQVITLNPTQEPSLRLKNPRLWWPAGEGEASLHTLELTLKVGGRTVASHRENFGIRKIETYLREGSRVFRINGREMFLQGGNWVNDMMFTWTASRYEREVELALGARLNFLRVWGPNGVPPQAFFEAADRRGLLLWQDFLHDHWGTFQSRRGHSPELGIYLRATEAIIRSLRNHPSLFMWCGGNEGRNPREDAILGELLPKLDSGAQRPYLRSSDGDGLRGGGPYHNITPAEYFSHPKLSGFNSEVGPSGVPEWESIQKFVTDLAPTAFTAAPSPAPTDSIAERFPVSAEWAYHDATDTPGTDPRKFSTYDALLRRCYGAPRGTGLAAARDYSFKTQLVNYDAYRAAVEALNRNLLTKTTGFALWKFNSSWPSFTWQLSDWYMQSNAAYYATRQSCEPVHLQFNRDTRELCLVNRLYTPATALKATISLHDSSGLLVWQKALQADAKAQSASILPCEIPPTTELRLLKLVLQDAAGQQLSTNLYWLHDGDDFSELQDKLTALLALQAEKSIKQETARVRLSNAGTSVALLVRLKLISQTTGLEVLPTYWSDNYISLLPGEERVVEARVMQGDFPQDAVFVAEGFHAPAVQCLLSK